MYFTGALPCSLCTVGIAKSGVQAETPCCYYRQQWRYFSGTWVGGSKQCFTFSRHVKIAYSAFKGSVIKIPNTGANFIGVISTLKKSYFHLQK